MNRIDDAILSRSSQEFKARAYLDSHRGQRIPGPIRRRCRQKKVTGYKLFLPQLVDLDQPIPDRWYGTNCTPELWAVGVDQCQLKTASLKLWLWLHSLDWTHPRIVSRSDAAGLLNTVSCNAIRLLRQKGLILAIDPPKGGHQWIYEPLAEPLPKKVIYSRFRSRVPRLRSPSGRCIAIVESTEAIARRYNLHPRCLQAVIDGEAEQHNGWTLAPRS